MAAQTLQFATLGTTVTASVTYDDVTMILQSIQGTNTATDELTVTLSGGVLSSPVVLTVPSGTTQIQSLPSTLIWTRDLTTNELIWPVAAGCSLVGVP
jgi:hypothetical protein